MKSIKIIHGVKGLHSLVLGLMYGNEKKYFVVLTGRKISMRKILHFFCL